MGMWIGCNESAKYWLGVLNEIKNHGVEDIMIVSVDRLSGFVDTIAACLSTGGNTVLYCSSDSLYN